MSSHPDPENTGTTLTEAVPVQLGSQKRRILAPDLARGLALFGIAWANIATAWVVTDGSVPGAYFGGIREGAAGVFDQIVVVLSAMFAHVRGLPMFTTLLGFGVGLITVSLARRQYPPGKARRVLARRYAFLLLFGIVHCIFLFFGDIMILYGIIGIVLGMMITLSNRALLWIAGILYGIHVLANLSMALALAVGAVDASMLGTSPAVHEAYGDYFAHNLPMAFMYFVSAPFLLLSMLPVAILGFVAARAGVHTNPAAFRRTLRAWIIVALVIIVAIGLPWGLSAIGVLPVAWEAVFMGLNQAFGYLTGPGIAAAILLACQGLQERVDNKELTRLPLVLEMHVALGKRSMSGYLLQSLLFVLAVMPFTLALGQGAGAAGLMLMAAVIYLITLLAAWGLEKAGRPGPFEQLHRRLSYGRDGLQEQWRPKEQ